MPILKEESTGPKVTAIITTHNRLPLLKRAIDSVIDQTYSNIELIVVSDNSTDGTVEYCNGRNDFQFIGIPASESKGGNYARNLGIKAARGEYVAFLDDDDYWLPTKVKKQMALMESKQCDLVYCGQRIETLSLDGQIKYSDSLPEEMWCGNVKDIILTKIVTTTSAILVKKSALLEVGLFDENLRFWQEYELTIRLAQRSPFFFVNEPLLVYRVDTNDAGRLTNKYHEWWDAVGYIHKKHKKLYARLSFKEMRFSKLLVYNDALVRAKTCGLDTECLHLNRLIKLWSIPEILSDKWAAKFQ